MSDRPTPETDAAEAKRRAEWLHKHKAHKDWIILSVSEIAVIRGELLAVERARDEWAAMCGNYKQERDEAREALMKIEEIFVDGCDTCADREKMGLIARAALEETK